MQLEDWLGAHPYLRPVASFCHEVERAAATVAAPPMTVPSFDAYRADFLAGVPLLQSARAAFDPEPLGHAALATMAKLATAKLPDDRATAVRELDAALRREPAPARRVADWLLGDPALAPPHPGLLRYVGWTAAERRLRPLLVAFARWRHPDEERWMRCDCPACGAPPAMAQLIGEEPGRLRFLVCGCCATRWRFGRTECPFCDCDSRRLEVVKPEGESGLRLDACESCRGYLKTYDGRGSEDVLLADWTSLHLDVLALDRGLERRAASLFELEPGRAASTPES
jgi:FdhE protein